MSKIYKLITSASVAVVILAVGYYAIRQFAAPMAKPNNAAPKIKITASFYPLYYFTSQIAGEYAQVENLTPSGIEPHDYEPSARDLINLESSQLIIINGRGLESWQNDLTKNIDSRISQLLVISDQLVTADDLNNDPHLWLSPQTAQEIVKLISQTIIKLDPTNQTDYQNNTNQLLDRLKELDRAYASGLNNCEQKKIVTTHAAFAHLAQAYGLEQLAITGLTPEVEPSLNDLAALSQTVKVNKISYIFFESLISPKLAQTLAQETGASTLELNPLEGLTADQVKNQADYFTIMQNNLTNLKTALKCQK